MSQTCMTSSKCRSLNIARALTCTTKKCAKRVVACHEEAGSLQQLCVMTSCIPGLLGEVVGLPGEAGCPLEKRGYPLEKVSRLQTTQAT